MGALQGLVERGQIILKDGTTAQLRPVTEGDRPQLVRFLKRVSPASRHQRFFGEVQPERAASYLVKPNQPDTRLSLLMLTGPAGNEKVIGHAGYIRDAPDSDTAEVAFIVDDAFQGKGVGTLLLERLALIAVRYGIRRFYGPTEAQNRQMRDLFRASGFSSQEDVHGGYADVTCVILPSAQSVSYSEQREAYATIASLQHFFRPASIALVGTLHEPTSVGQRILNNLITGGFSGPIYLVDPDATTDTSHQVYASVSDIPEPADLVVVSAPAAKVPELVAACGKAHMRSLVFASDGFVETDAGKEGQAALLRTVRGFGMRVLGPDSIGVLNTAAETSMNASLSPTFPSRGHLAVASQSGTLGLALLDLLNQLGLGVSSFVGLGGKADISGNDLLQFWEADPETRIILLYLESFGNPKRFSRLARRVGRSKPIVVVKAGRSPVHHLSACEDPLVVSDVSDAELFRQSGVIRVDTVSELFELAALLTGQPLLSGPRVAVVTNARGPAILAADALVAGGLDLPALSENVQHQLKTVLPFLLSPSNPLDMRASAGAAEYRSALSLLLGDSSFDALLVIFVPTGVADPNEVLDAVGEATRLARQTGVTKPVVACVVDAQARKGTLKLKSEAIPLFRFPEAAARALAKSFAYARWRDRPLGVVPTLSNIDPDQGRWVARTAPRRDGGWLSTSDADTLLRAFGLPLLQASEVTSADEAVAAADLLGYPVVVKLTSPTLLPKSAWEGVKLGLSNGDAVREACTAIQERLEAAGRLRELSGFLVQPTAPDGQEMFIRVTHNPRFGPLLSFGLAGIHAELMHDVSHRLTPLSVRDVEEMIRELRCYPLLRGYRGAATADIDGFKNLVMRVSRLVEEMPEVVEINLDPIRVQSPGKGCIIVGAAIQVHLDTLIL